MFRTKRSLLVRRLWRSRVLVPGGGEDGDGTGERPHGSGRSGVRVSAGKGAEAAEVKSLTHSVLKKLKEKQLEGLVQAVEGKGGSRGPCLLLPAGKLEPRAGQTFLPLPLLLCKVFRWPDLRHSAQVKRLNCCDSYGKNNPDLLCCNPHHLSRLCELESPPPPYTRYPMDFLKPTAGPPDSSPSSTETGGTNFLAPEGLSDSHLFHETGDPSHWCVWRTGRETRVGRLYLFRNPPWISSMIYLRGWLLPRTA
ncbi:hypothetical protein GDO86_002587 [Hymenochirus boettgeri]|uniref:MH1 domain-containing protein n=1 Tax=Hymenochirus boettgeri TaxID=247094 RepID=A0A8T2KHG3_9PIPI|nr:hypothetical protein GDO86_002587 [Hymenochirus boettgeri]